MGEGHLLAARIACAVPPDAARRRPVPAGLLSAGLGSPRAPAVPQPRPPARRRAPGAPRPTAQIDYGHLVLRRRGFHLHHVALGSGGAGRMAGLGAQHKPVRRWSLRWPPSDLEVLCFSASRQIRVIEPSIATAAYSPVFVSASTVVWAFLLVGLGGENTTVTRGFDNETLAWSPAGGKPAALASSPALTTARAMAS